MYKIFIILSLLLSNLYAEVEWESYDVAFKEAQKENKAVMIMFSSPSCKVCKYMKNEVYTDERVSEYLDEHFISVEIDYHDNPDTKKFPLLGTPNYFFFDPQGKLLRPQMLGGAKTEKFLTILQDVIKKFGASH
jgi:thioredoxin-related protein